MPALSSGGGALNRGRGGVGSCGGVGSLCTVSALDLRGAGGGGGAPRREPDEDMLSEIDRPPPAGGGGGGGGARLWPWLPNPLTAEVADELLDGGGGGGGGAGAGAVIVPSLDTTPPCSFKNSTMKSWFSRINSSVSPCSERKFPKLSRQFGSYASNLANLDGDLWKPLTFVEEVLAWDCAGGRLLRGDSGGVGAEECLCPPKMLPKNPVLVWCCCDAPPKGVFLVALDAFFSRSSIFFLNCFASFSSTKDRPAKQSSSSKVWKNVRS